MDEALAAGEGRADAASDEAAVVWDLRRAGGGAGVRVCTRELARGRGRALAATADGLAAARGVGAPGATPGATVARGDGGGGAERG
jgi:hypothetical protein